MALPGLDDYGSETNSDYVPLSKLTARADKIAAKAEDDELQAYLKKATSDYRAADMPEGD